MNQKESKSIEVVNDLLGYPGLKIIQRPDMFNFSLDSTILSYYVTINKRCKNIIDLGCGNGFIPIFLSLRTKSKIIGVEIQEELALLAKKSVKLNNLEEQIYILNDDLNDIYKKVGVSKFDVVTSNPPYFKYEEDSNINDSEYKTLARHEVKTNLDLVVKSASILLKDGGTFAIVHRASRLCDVLDTFKKYSIEPKRLLFVYPKVNKDALAIFVEGIKSNKSGGLKVLPPLYVNDEFDKYTSEILDIFNYKDNNHEKI